MISTYMFVSRDISRHRDGFGPQSAFEGLIRIRGDLAQYGRQKRPSGPSEGGTIEARCYWKKLVLKVIQRP